MAFLHRLASGLKDGLSSLTNETQRILEGPQRSLQKISSRGRRPTSVSLGYLEEHTRDAIASFVQEKFDKGECKPHVFTQFWLQFPKLEAGFEILRRQLEQRTGSREGPLPLAVLHSTPQDFGLDESSHVVQELCSRAMFNKCTDIDFVGLVMLLLVVHLAEPAPASRPLHPDVRTMLSCLELAFTHFNSARKGKLDKREVGEALQYEAAKAHTREGRFGRTSNRLAHRLFEGLDWENDNTISFENFLRGIVQLIQDEFGDVADEEEEDTLSRQPSSPNASTAAGGAAAGGSAGPSRAGSAHGSPAPLLAQSRQYGSGRVEATSQPLTGMADHGSERRRRRSASATGMGSAPPVGRHGSGGLSAVGEAGSPEVSRRGGSFIAVLKGALRKSTELVAGEKEAKLPPLPASARKSAGQVAVKEDGVAEKRGEKPGPVGPPVAGQKAVGLEETSIKAGQVAAEEEEEDVIERGPVKEADGERS